MFNRRYILSNCKKNLKFQNEPIIMDTRLLLHQKKENFPSIPYNIPKMYPKWRSKQKKNKNYIHSIITPAT